MNNLATSLSIQVLQSSTASLNDYRALSGAKLSTFDLFESRYQYLNFKLKRKHKLLRLVNQRQVTHAHLTLTLPQKDV